MVVGRGVRQLINSALGNKDKRRQCHRRFRKFNRKSWIQAFQAMKINISHEQGIILDENSLARKSWQCVLRDRGKIRAVMLDRFSHPSSSYTEGEKYLIISDLITWGERYLGWLKKNTKNSLMFTLYSIDRLIRMARVDSNRQHDYSQLRLNFWTFVENLDCTEKYQSLGSPWVNEEKQILMERLISWIPDVLATLVISYCQLNIMAEYGEKDEEVIMDRIIKF